MTPVRIQTRSSQPLEPTSRAMSAETMKMPEPIMVPATSMVASKRPRRLLKPLFAEEGSPREAVLILRLVSIQGHARRGMPCVEISPHRLLPRWLYLMATLYKK